MTYPFRHYATPVLVALGLFASLASLRWGEVNLTWSELASVWTQPESLAATIVRDLRLPRLLTAALAGAALAASGLVLQAYFRNSLASPGLLGVSAGGAAGAVLALATGLTLHSLWALPVASLLGAALATSAVLLLARQGASRERLLLAGVALNALLGAVVSYVISHTALTFEKNAQILFWLLGGLEDRTWEHVLMASPIVLAAAWLWPLGRPLDLLSLGEREAASLGVDVRHLRRSLLALTTVLTALATAVVGTVGFVGLLVPHVLRLTVGPEHKRLLPLSLLGGATFVVLCDLLGRLAGGVRVGIVTSLLGGPFFLWLLRRSAP